MPLHVLSSLWLGVSTNVDNFAVGVAYGIKRIRIGIMSNALIGLCNALGTLVSMAAGETVSKFLPGGIAGYVGNGIIILTGLWGLINTFGFGKKGAETARGESQRLLRLEYLAQHPEILDLDRSGRISARQSLPLALALSVSNLGTGAGAGLAGFKVGFLVLIMFIFSMLGISLGYAFGNKFSLALPGRWPGVISGLLLMALGVYEILS